MTANAFVDACGFIATSTGTVDFVVSAAIVGYQTPAGAGAVNASVYSYRAESADKSQWEEGFGAYTVAGTTLARTTVTASSTGAKVSFSAAPNVFITALSADLQNAALLTSGTLPVARINGGTVNQMVQGDGSFVTQGRKLLNTLTASNSASLSDTTSISAAFSSYEIVLENILPVTNNVTVHLQVQVGGTFQTASYTSSTNNANGSANGSTSDTAGVGIGPALLIVNTGAGLSAKIHLTNPAQTSSSKFMYGPYVSSSSVGISGGGYTGGSGAVTGIQVLCSSGNISSGNMKIYGLN